MRPWSPSSILRPPLDFHFHFLPLLHPLLHQPPIPPNNNCPSLSTPTFFLLYLSLHPYLIPHIIPQLIYRFEGRFGASRFGRLHRRVRKEARLTLTVGAHHSIHTRHYLLPPLRKSSTTLIPPSFPPQHSSSSRRVPISFPHRDIRHISDPP